MSGDPLRVEFRVEQRHTSGLVMGRQFHQPRCLFIDDRTWRVLAGSGKSETNIRSQNSDQPLRASCFTNGDGLTCRSSLAFSLSIIKDYLEAGTHQKKWASHSGFC